MFKKNEKIGQNKPDTATIFRDWLSTWVKSKNLTQLQAAKMFDLTPGYISHIINGRRSASMATMENIAIKTGITLTDILKATEPIKLKDAAPIKTDKTVNEKNVKYEPVSANLANNAEDKKNTTTKASPPTGSKKTTTVVDIKQANVKKREKQVPAVNKEIKSTPINVELKAKAAPILNVTPDPIKPNETPKTSPTEKINNFTSVGNRQEMPTIDTLVKIPLYGASDEASDSFYYNETNFVYVTKDEAKDKAFAVTVSDNSMAPRIEKGDIVVTAPNRIIENGDVVLVVWPPEDDEEGKLLARKCYVAPNGLVMFLSDNNCNKEYPPMYLDPCQQKSRKISIYRVVKIIKTV